MGVPMRMRCDNCGYDFVGQLQYSDQRQGDVIRCKACEYEVPMISDEEIAEVETMLNKERNMAFYALIAWAVCFIAMVVWGLSYFWQAGTGLGSDKTKNKDEILWTSEGRTALYLKTNLSSDEKTPIPNSSILLNVADSDPLAKKLEEYNDKLTKMNKALEYIGDSVKDTVLPAITAKMEPYLRKQDPSVPGDWTKIDDAANKAAFYEMKTGDDITVKSASPTDPQDLALKLFLGMEVRPVEAGSDDDPNILSKAELRYTDGDITLAYDPFARRVIRTEIKRPGAAATPETASAVVFGRAAVVPITSFPSDGGRGTHPALQVLSPKAAKDTSPTSITFFMLILWILALIAAIPLTWLANKGRYTMQLGIIEKEPEVEPEALEEEGGDIGAEDDIDLGDNNATAKMDDDIEIS